MMYSNFRFQCGKLQFCKNLYMYRRCIEYRYSIHPYKWKGNAIVKRKMLIFCFQRLPFNWKNPVGYAVAALIEYIMTVYLFLIATSILCAAFEGLLTTNAIINDLKGYLLEINGSGTSKKTHSKATEEFYDFIQIHSLLIQLSELSLFLHKKISSKTLKILIFFFQCDLIDL